MICNIVKRKALKESLILEEDFKEIIKVHLIIVKGKLNREMSTNNSRCPHILVLGLQIMKNLYYNILMAS